MLVGSVEHYIRSGAYLALRPTELGDDQQILRDLESGKTKYAYQPTGTGEWCRARTARWCISTPKTVSQTRQ